MKNALKFTLLAFIAGFAGAFVCYEYFIKPSLPQSNADYKLLHYDSNATAEHVIPENQPLDIPDDGSDFAYAAAKATPSVVFINSISKGASYSYWDWFFGQGGNSNRTQVSTGSGVIFTSDGYIITNNHVVETAERLEVSYNKRTYPAELIGTDPSSDLAVIKINETNLPAATIGSSKNVQVGEWVIAVGNPYTLASTVTAGIVSAKGRRIGILEDKFPIESFIQTDAAINPGNSGGALVNKRGELVGINSAILSRTGSYTGYAFAIPVDIAKKIFDDLVKYGSPQKAVFGGNVTEYNYENAKKYDLPTEVKRFQGVLLEKLDKEGPAIQAGLRLGDVITHIDGKSVNTQSEFEEELSYRYPGNKLNITYSRDEKSYNTNVTLVNKNGTTDLIKRQILTDASLGASLESTNYGVKVFKLTDNSILKQIGIPENFTIIALNRQRVSTPAEVSDFFANYKGRGYVFGMNSKRQQLEIPFVIR
jgi:serine protease Do